MKEMKRMKRMSWVLLVGVLLGLAATNEVSAGGVKYTNEDGD